MARLPANFSELLAIRQDRAPTLDAKIHDGYDATAEHKEQGNLLSSVQYGQGAEGAYLAPVDALLPGNIALSQNIVPVGPGDTTFGINNVSSFNFQTAPLVINNDNNSPVVIASANPAVIGESSAQIGNFASTGNSGASVNIPGFEVANNGADFRSTPSSNIAVPAPVANIPNPPPVDDGTDTMPNPNPNPGPMPTPVTPPTTPVITAPNVDGNEDTTISLPIGITNVITITGVPLDAVLSAGTRNNDGSYTLTPAQLGGLTITPAHDYNGTISLTVTATTTQDGTSVTAVAHPIVTVESIADAPPLTVTTTPNSDHTYNVNITTSLVHPSPTETLTITIDGLPAGTLLNHGTHNSDGTWTLTPAQLAGLVLTPPANYNGDISLLVTSTAADNGTSAATATVTHINVLDVADAPTLSVQTAAGLEDTSIALNISVVATDTNPAEILTVTISGLPVGATLNHGTLNSNGSYSLTVAQLNGLTITPANNYNGAFDLNVTATAAENGTSASIAAPLHVTVTATADIPNLAVQAASGNENTLIALNIATSLSDGDVGETLNVIIGGIPNGATLNHGTHNSDGTWSLTPAQLSGLTITTPATWGGTLQLTVTAITAENGTTAMATANLPVTVTMPGNTATSPVLTVNAAAGNEDTPIAISLNATTATAGETISVVISGVPAGASFNHGTNNGNGSWTFTPAQLSGLTFTAPLNASGTYVFAVDAIGTHAGDTAHAVANMNITIAGIADAPNLAVVSATGAEDNAVALNITSSLVDNDGSETLVLNLSGFPAGASLNHGTHNSDGSWTLTAAQLSGLTVTPPANYNGAFDIHVTATASENNTSTAVSADLHVTVTAVADAPQLSVTSASGAEDTQIALTINATEIDLNGTLSLTLTGLPTGALLNHGVHNSNGSWTLTPADLAGLKITPPANYSGDFTISVTATSTEGGSTANVTAPLAVHVTAVADAPNLTVTGNVTVAEGHDVPLTIASTLNDTDGSEHLSILIAGVPSGCCLSAGLNNGNGTWSLTPAQLANLHMTVPPFWSGDISLTVTATATEGSNADHASVMTPINVHITPVADVPHLLCVPAIGLEGTPIALAVAASLSDADGSETLGVTISGVPAGCVLNHGTNNGNGTWTLTLPQLVGLTLTPPAHYHGDFNLTVTATATETLTGINAHVDATLGVHVEAVANLPSVFCNNATGGAGAQIALVISGALADAGETISYIVHGVPNGFAFNHGCNNGDNSWTLNQADLTNLKLITPDSFNGRLNLHVEAVSHEASNGDSNACSPVNLLVSIGNWSNGTFIDLGVDAHVGGIGVGVGVDLFPATGGLLAASIHMKEDVPFAITDAPQLLSLSSLNGLTGLVSNITCSGVPAGCIFNNGANLGNGIWQFTTANLTGLTLATPANYSGDFNLTLTANFIGGHLPVALVITPVHVMGIADLPTLSVSAAANVTEDHPLTVTINGALTDLDGSESLTYLVSGLPAGFTLNHGTCNDNGTWSLKISDLAGLVINPAEHYNSVVHATVSAIATELSGSSVIAQQNLNFTVDAVVHAPLLTVHDVSVNESAAVSLNLGAALVTHDGSEHLTSILISGLPAGANLSYATDNHNGTWSVDLTHINDVQLTAGAHWSGDTNLTVAATSQVGSAGLTATATATLGLHVEAVAHTPVITVADSSGYDEAPIALHLGVTQPDIDSSEHLSIVISGVPAGAILSEGIHNANGTWSLEQQMLDHLTITAPDHFSGDMQLHLAAWNTESTNGHMASIQQDFAVHVAHH